MTRPDSNIDRFHNHEDMSPEAMAKEIDDLKDTVGGLDGRLAAAEAGAVGAANATKDLGASMFKMGDALSKRVKSLEDSTLAAVEAAQAAAAAEKARAAQAAKRSTRDRRLMFAAGLAAGLIVAVAGVALLKPQITRPAPPAQVLYSPNAPAAN